MSKSKGARQLLALEKAVNLAVMEIRTNQSRVSKKHEDTSSRGAWVVRL